MRPLTLSTVIQRLFITWIIIIAKKTAQVVACLKTIKRVRLENLELKNGVKLLTTRLAETDQYSWGNCVEI